MKENKSTNEQYVELENEQYTDKYKEDYTDKYIDVAIPLPLNQTFTYKVPAHLAQNTATGMRVLVPFGRRRITGYVIGKKHENASNYKPKLILDLLDDIALFPPSMVSLFNWISRYYIHPIGEVIRTALPVGLDSHDVSLVCATENGVDGIVVSNHGGRQLDSCKATIEVLPEIAEEVKGKAALLIDGGIRRGTDILKAIALGADAVLIGRPVVYGLAYNGEEGVKTTLNILRSELDLAMALCGCSSIRNVDKNIIAQ